MRKNDERWERKIQKKLEIWEIFQVFRAIDFQILALLVATQRSLVVRLPTFGNCIMKVNPDIPGYICDSAEDHNVKKRRWKRVRRSRGKENRQEYSKKKVKKKH